MLARTESSQGLHQVGDFSGLQIFVLCTLFTVIASIPIITHPLPPIEDYMNHLARMHVIAAIGHVPNLAEYYEIDWQIVPNLVMDILLPPLARFVNIYMAGQIFTISTFALIVSGTLAVNRVLFGRWSALPLIVCPLLYNFVFLVGIMNYLFGVGLALWALAAWLALLDRPLILRLAVSTAFVIALFFCHLYAVGIYGIEVLGVALWRLWSKRGAPAGRQATEFFSAGLPFLPVVPLLLLSPTLGLWDYGWEPRGKIDGLIYVIQVYSDMAAFALVAVMSCALIWSVRHRLFRFHPIGLSLLSVGAVVYLAMPRTLFAVYMADQRLPIALAFMAIACSHMELGNQLVRRAFLALTLALVLMRVIEVDVAWAELSPVTLEFRNSIKRISPGSRILVAYADPSGGDDVADLGLVHAACLAMIERSALVTTAFTVPGKQIMHVRKKYRDQVDTEDGQPPTVAELMDAIETPKHQDNPRYWSSWQDRFDYVYVLFTDDEARNPAPQFLAPVYDGGRFQLYKVIRPH